MATSRRVGVKGGATGLRDGGCVGRLNGGVGGRLGRNGKQGWRRWVKQTRAESLCAQ
ncbi:hypothetical protein A2U01_0017918 [Trifolium medium]|uniref:Uncharacterized protein n=1 Tax=Trifolium medium TaxID=97028 RepID=A0A392NAQ9_9FABA|nr:hypothetical protein [Trifolium medium]